MRTFLICLDLGLIGAVWFVWLCLNAKPLPWHD